MASSPEEKLKALGATVRAARDAQRLTQQWVADHAGVSRAQLALLEKGRNVSLLFLLRVAALLDLKLEFVGGTSGGNIFELLRVIENVGASVDELRSIALDTVIPGSSHGRLDDAVALREFITRHGTDANGLARLADDILKSSAETMRAPRQPKPVSDREARRRRRNSER